MTPMIAPFCAAPDGRRDYCGPEDFRAQPDRLYRNNGDGTFTDVSREAGIDLPEGRGLGVVIAELTGDNRPDIYVANDSSACWLFANRGNLRFEEIGEESGVARDGDGEVLSGMGVAHGDLDGDGLLDLVVANFYERSTIAFRAQSDAARPVPRRVELAGAQGRHATGRRLRARAGRLRRRRSRSTCSRRTAMCSIGSGWARPSPCGRPC